MELKEILKQFCLCSSASGEEQEISKKAYQIMAPFGECETDLRGNFFCRKAGNGKHYLLDAHMDQIGFTVTEICEGGFLKIAKVGGIDFRVLPSQEVIVLGSKPLFGIIGAKPPHLTSNKEENSAPKPEDIAIDTGLSKKELESIVSLGDRVVFKPLFSVLNKSAVTGTSIDDRAGMAIIARAMQILKEKGSTSQITALFSVQEEVGNQGADNASFKIQADEAIAVDVSFASQPEIPSDKKTHTMAMGGGVFIGIAPVLDREMFEKMKAVADKNGIKYEIEAMGGRTGTNADGIATAKFGTKTMILSPPIRNMHTPVEVVDVNDLESVAQLIAEYILSEEAQG